MSKIEKICQATILGSIVAVVLGGNEFATENLLASFVLTEPRTVENLTATEPGGFLPDQLDTPSVSPDTEESIPAYSHVVPYYEDDESDIGLALLSKLDPTPTEPSERFSWWSLSY